MRVDEFGMIGFYKICLFRRGEVERRWWRRWKDYTGVVVDAVGGERT